MHNGNSYREQLETTMTNTNKTLQRLLIAAAIALPLTVLAAEAPAPAASGAEAQADGGAPPPPQWGPGAPDHAGMQHDGGGEGFGHGGPGRGEGPHFGHGPEHGEGFGHGPFGGPGGEPPFLRGLKLSDAQQDKLFAIKYADLPLLRDQHKVIEKSHEALHEMTRSGKYDDAKASALVQAITQAMGKVMLLQLRSEQQMLAVLTPEQRQELDERKAHMGGPGRDGKEGKDGKGRPARPQ